MSTSIAAKSLARVPRVTGRILFSARAAARRAARRPRRGLRAPPPPSSRAGSPSPAGRLWPRAASGVRSSASQALSRSAIALTGSPSRANETRGAASAGSSSASARLTSSAPGVGGRDRQHAGGGGLGGDHPERLREGAGEDEGVGSRDERPDLVVLEAARRRRRCRPPPTRPPGSRRAGWREEGGQDRQRCLLGRPRGRGPLAASSRSGSRSPRSSASATPPQRRLELAEAGDQQPSARDSRR